MFPAPHENAHLEEIERLTGIYQKGTSLAFYGSQSDMENWQHKNQAITLACRIFALAASALLFDQSPAA